MSEEYNLVVIGAGAAGLTASAFGGELGAKVALIEKAKLGGDCTWVGCVPSKALLKVAKVAHSMRTADTYGIQACEPKIDMKAVKEYVQSRIHDVYEGETPEVFEKRGVEVITGEAYFVDAHTIRVHDRELKAKKIVIATGATPAVPDIPGLDQIDYKTNQNLFENDILPEHLIIMGAGAIGMEMGQAYRRLGAEVTIIAPDVMPRDDHDAVQLMRDIFTDEGINIIDSKVTQFDKEGETIIAAIDNGETVRGDMLLVAVGRAPNVDGYGLENTGVKYGKKGITVDTHLKTNIPHIYAIGDCTDGVKLTHYAGYQGSVAGRNALFPVVNSGGKPDIFPWVTFTDPEVAQVGLTEKQAREKHGSAAKVFTLPLTEGDRAVAEHETCGFIKLVYRGSGDLLGATVVAPRAGEMIQEFVAVLSGGSLRGLMGQIHAYPTYSDIVKKSASQLVIKELLDGTTGKLIDTVSKIIW